MAARYKMNLVTHAANYFPIRKIATQKLLGYAISITNGEFMSERDFLRAAAFYLLKRAAEEAAERVSREWDEKQRNWMVRQNENIARWAEQYESNITRIKKLDANVEKLTERLANTKNKVKAAEVESWLAESNQKKRGLESRNRELEEKVRDVERKLTQGGVTPFFYRDSSHGRQPFNHRSIGSGRLSSSSSLRSNLSVKLRRF